MTLFLSLGRMNRGSYRGLKTFLSSPLLQARQPGSVLPRQEGDSDIPPEQSKCSLKSQDVRLAQPQLPVCLLHWAVEGRPPGYFPGRERWGFQQLRNNQRKSSFLETEASGLSKVSQKVEAKASPIWNSEQLLEKSAGG